MNRLLRVLQVEDSESDAALIVRLLERADFKVEWQRVQNAAQMRAALVERTWDVIVADYHLPQFGAPAALRILHDASLDIPFIVVSGVMGEGTAVEMMKAGAHDYVLKSNLARLVPAVEREIRDARTRFERRRAEQALTLQTQLVNLSHDAIITADSNRVITAWNAGAQELYEWTEAEAIGNVMHRFIHTASAIPIAEIDDVLRQHGRWDGELVHTRRDGRQVWVESRQVLLRDAAGEPAGLLEVNRDITDRKRAEESLQARAAELEAIMDAIPVAMFIARDAECHTIIGNRAAYELLRLPPGSNLSKSPSPGEAPAAFRAMRDGTEVPPHELPVQKAAATGQSVYDLELEFVLEDGSRRDIIGNAVPFLDASGRARGAVAIFVDITERKQGEERLRQSQKLESIGLLAGGVAHDFNNLLTVIIGSASAALLECPSCQSSKDVITASERAAYLTKQLLAYAGKGQFITKTFNLSDLVERATPLLSASVPKRVSLSFDLSREDLLIEADYSQTEQILMNLVINAGEAIPPRTDGRIRISTSGCEMTAEVAGAHVPGFDAQPGRFVCLQVEDNGAGMDEATVSRIFDPFFTTKFTGRGLGLAAVYGIVRGRKGLIDVHSSPGAGTTFRVYLPAAGTERSAELPIYSRPEAAWRTDRKGATILIVDDEDMVRKLACMALRSRGYEVLEAEDGKHALEVLAGAAPAPAVALVDLAMPVMGGDELVPILEKDYSGMKVVVTSGYPEEEARKAFQSGKVAGFLQKPYTVLQLAEKLEETLYSGDSNEGAQTGAAELEDVS